MAGLQKNLFRSQISNLRGGEEASQEARERFAGEQSAHVYRRKAARQGVEKERGHAVDAAAQLAIRERDREREREREREGDREREKDK
jgi:hypothetical protein